jgi:thymidylate synthase
MQKIIEIVDKTLPGAWFQLLYAALEHGRKFKIDKGSYAGSNRLEFDFIVAHIEQPWLRDTDGLPLIPEMPEGSNLPAPVAKDYIAQYAPYIMEEVREEGESYTYGQRMRGAQIPNFLKEEILADKARKIFKKEGDFMYSARAALGRGYNAVDQVDSIIKTYREGGHRNNQMCIEIAQPNDIILKDPPCLRSIDTRIQDNKLHFYIYFRSWDLWGGFPANLAGISLLQEYMSNEIGVDPGEFICTSKGLHLYESCIDVAKLRCHKELNIK